MQPQNTLFNPLNLVSVSMLCRLLTAQIGSHTFFTKGEEGKTRRQFHKQSRIAAGEVQRDPDPHPSVARARLSPDVVLERLHHSLGGVRNVNGVERLHHGARPSFVFAEPAADRFVFPVGSHSDEEFALVTVFSLEQEMGKDNK